MVQPSKWLVIKASCWSLGCVNSISADSSAEGLSIKLTSAPETSGYSAEGLSIKLTSAPETSGSLEPEILLPELSILGSLELGPCSSNDILLLLYKIGLNCNSFLFK